MHDVFVKQSETGPETIVEPNEPRTETLVDIEASATGTVAVQGAVEVVRLQDEHLPIIEDQENLTTSSDVDGGIFRQCVETKTYVPFLRRKVSYKDPGSSKQRRAPKSAAAVNIDDVDSVKAYLQGIGQFPLLSSEGEVYLSKYIQAGLMARVALGDVEYMKEKQLKKYTRLVDAIMDSQDLDKRQRDLLTKMAKDGRTARNIMMESNLRLVVSNAKRYTGLVTSLDLKDLIQEGNFGLAVAAEGFDWRKGFRFTTYATNWIKQSITRAIGDKERTIRLPVHAADTVSRINRVLKSAQDLRPDHKFTVRDK